MTRWGEGMRSVTSHVICIGGGGIPPPPIDDQRSSLQEPINKLTCMADIRQRQNTIAGAAQYESAF